MKITKAIILTLFVIQFGFSQTERAVYGKVISYGSPIRGADVINYTTKTNTTTGPDGFFSIMAKPNDVLLFYHKNYFDRKVIMTPKLLDSLNVELILKPIELDEVIIANTTMPHLKKNDPGIEYMRLKMLQERPMPLGVYDGSMPYGINIIGVVGSLYGLVFGKRNSEPKKYVRELTFKEYVAANIKEDYYTKVLKLEPKEIPQFIAFCDLDSRSGTVLRDVNILKMMDFLLEKSVEFKKVYH